MKATVISVISPVYNVQEFLPAFIQSVISQSFADWELILVDDGSSDGSGRICDKFAETDERIKALHKDNGGVCSARNTGIRNACGCWLYFADPDDELLPECLETLFASASADVDLISASYERFESGALVPKKILKDGGRCDVVGFLKEITSLPNARFFERYLWTKLFRRSIIEKNDVSFREDFSYREDVVFLFTYLSRCKSAVVWIDRDVYRYYRRADGAAERVTGSFSKHSFDMFYSLAVCYDLVGGMEGCDEVRKNLTREMLFFCFHIHRLILRDGVWRETKAERRRMLTDLKETVPLRDIVSVVAKRMFLPSKRS